MLQRPQTLFLLGAFILSLLLLVGSLAEFSMQGSDYVLKSSGLFGGEGERMQLVTWPLLLFFIVLGSLSFLNIFFYRHRVRQMRICVFLILLNLGAVAMMFFYVYMARLQLEGALVLYKWRFVAPPISVILNYFAFRRIRRDELMVKAYDRIR